MLTKKNNLALLMWTMACLAVVLIGVLYVLTRDKPFVYDDFSHGEVLTAGGFFEGINARDYVDLTGFDVVGMLIPSFIHQVEDWEIDEIVFEIMMEYGAVPRIFNRAVEDGDWVAVSFDGTIDGEAFEGGSTDGEVVFIQAGVGDMLTELSEGILDAMPGETVLIEIDFDDDWDENFAGKTAVFEVLIHFIVDTEDNLSDGDVHYYFYALYGWRTVADMREELRTELFNEDVYNYIGAQIEAFVAENVNLGALPLELLNYMERMAAFELEDTAAMFGLTLEDLLDQFYDGGSLREYLNESRIEFLSEIGVLMTIQAIAEYAAINVTLTDVSDYLTRVGIGLSAVEFYGPEYVAMAVLQHLVVEYILENAIME
jgi:trigger factor